MGRKRRQENRIITRTYVSKKTGQTITKRYEYARTATYSKKTDTRAYTKKLISKQGKEFKAWSKYLSKYESISDQATLQNIARMYKQQGKVLTEARAEYELKHEKILSALDNTGYSLTEIAAQIGTSEKDLSNINNWDGSIYTDPNTGKRYQYEWTYEGTVLNELS